MESASNDKIARVLGIYTKLMNGYLINKAEEAQNYGVNERSIRRDIEDILQYLESDNRTNGFTNSVLYDRAQKGYRLEQIYHASLTNAEVLAVCKILLDSRSLTRAEMTAILDKLIECCVPKANQKLVADLIRNEEFHYVEPRHKTVFIDKMWTLGQAIRDCQYIQIDYERTKDHSIVTRKLKPVAILFSEYYFYLTAFIDDPKVQQDFEVLNDSFPTIYRVDRIKKLTVLDEHFHIPYSSRFEEGEFRKRVQFMYGGKLQTVKFKYSGPDIDAVLDRLPTAKVLDEDNGVYTVSAEVFGKGIDMWLRSQRQPRLQVSGHEAAHGWRRRCSGGHHPDSSAVWSVRLRATGGGSRLYIRIRSILAVDNSPLIRGALRYEFPPINERRCLMQFLTHIIFLLNLLKTLINHFS